ncbi:trypsin-like serine peptidase [Kineococcus sp. SYSU DK002]|uniref:trypsin-like serine peptidase n=1 Tax=Kineococcus sp. SYSU DK002 TaxID=3383123 RepID=UPI003D7F08EE
MRQHLTRRLIAASSAAVVTFGGLAAASSAAAVPAGESGAGVSLLSSVDEAAQQEALDYWTAERIAEATPLDRTIAAGGAGGDAGGAPAEAAASPATPVPSTRSTAATPQQPPTLTRSARTAAGTVTGDAVSRATDWTGGTQSRVGRLYFTQGAGKFECTASSVDSPKGNVVVTAGHCLTENGKPSTNVVFVPGLDGTEEPLGRFSIGKLFTTTQWRTQDQSSPAALNFDVGFAVASPRDGRSLKDTVGAYGIDFTDTLSRVTVLGYPGKALNPDGSVKVDGSTLQYCTGWQFTDSGPGSTTDRATLCDLAGGSSGGPWLRDLDPVTGAGTVTSVVSFSYDNNASVLYGPLLGEVAKAVYTEASTA